MDIKVSQIFVIIIAVVMLAYVGVGAFGAVFEPETRDVQQDVNQSVNLQGDLDAELVALNETEETADISIEGGTSQTVGVNETQTIDNVTVTVNEVNTDSAGITYEFDNTTGWSDGASSLVGLLVVFMLIGVVVILAEPLL